MAEGLLNVMNDPLAGVLDPISQEETDRDLRAILAYVRAEQQALVLNPGRARPSIARSVLTTIWQTPRTNFHREQITGRMGFAFGSKLLLVPWSMEAFDRLKSQNSVNGLILEHVTPIDAMWKRLVELAEVEDDEDWVSEAQHYLTKNFTVAVVTKEQAAAIDAVGLRKQGFEGKPFVRYQRAAELIRERAAEFAPGLALDVARFMHPGLGVSKHVEELARVDEENDDD